MQQRHDLVFAVFSDPGNALAQILGIPSSGVRALQLQLGLDLTAVNADDIASQRWPTTAILHRGRTLRWYRRPS